MNILVVDDDFAVRESLDRALRANGFDVQLASDGLEEFARSDAAPFDAVVLDVLMPGLDGMAVSRSLRAGGNRVPILMLTAREAAPDRVAGLEAGADDYLVKPFALEKLLARVRALLRRTMPGGRLAASPQRLPSAPSPASIPPCERHGSRRPRRSARPNAQMDIRQSLHRVTRLPGATNEQAPPTEEWR